MAEDEGVPGAMGAVEATEVTEGDGAKGQNEDRGDADAAGKEEVLAVPKGKWDG